MLYCNKLYVNDTLEVSSPVNTKFFQLSQNFKIVLDINFRQTLFKCKIASFSFTSSFIGIIEQNLSIIEFCK